MSGVGDQVARLRDALVVFSKDVSVTADRSFSPDDCRHVLGQAEIDVTPEQFDRAAIAFRQMPFYGGNYTLDAKRLLKAIGTTTTKGSDDE